MEIYTNLNNYYTKWPLVLIFFISIPWCSAERSFIVDYENDQFLKDGQPFRYISGSLHYFRSPYDLWRDRMERSRAMGVNAIQTYIQWSTHELYQGQYNFERDANIVEYLELAKNLSLLVILRIGPYIDNAVDFGGFPYWLLKYPNISLRTADDPRYTAAVEKWFSVLLPKIRPMLYVNGGPVIMVQSENEYGSYGCDHNYTTWLQNITMKYLQDHVVYFTTDGTYEYMIRCGQVPNTLTTIDFGSASEAEVVTAFETLRKYLPKGPKVNSEFYPGWFDVWGQAKRSTSLSLPVTNTMQYMWRQNASFNMFPIHGGTSWGYLGGSFDPPFTPVTTEFDNDAPISESGDIMPKFFDMKNTIENMTGTKVQYPVPKNSTKFNYGRFPVVYIGDVFDLLPTISPPETRRQSMYPLTMEYLDLPFGFVLYETVVTRNGRFLTIGEIRDRAYIIVDGQLTQVIQRNATRVNKIRLPRKVVNGSQIHILVENQGRVCYGSNIVDRKGLVSNVSLDNEILTNWTMYPLQLEKIYHTEIIFKSKKNFKKQKSIQKKDNYLPSFYFGYLSELDTIRDTYFNSTGWGKGQFFINSINIGRYYPTAGPQLSLYVPSCYLSEKNEILLFELDQPGNCNNKYKCEVSFVDNPIYT